MPTIEQNMYVPQSDDYDHHDMSADAIIDVEHIEPEALNFEELCVYIRTNLPNS